MKKSILVLVGIITMNVIAFAGNPPQKVIEAFKQKFPTAEKISWAKENATEYEANFTVSGVAMSANFSIEGIWLETEGEIPLAQLPENIKKAIAKQYPDWKVTGADKIETSKNGTRYEADLQSGTKKKEVIYSTEATEIK